MTTWKEAYELYKQDKRTLNTLKDERHAIKQTALVKVCSLKDFVKKRASKP